MYDFETCWGFANYLNHPIIKNFFALPFSASYICQRKLKMCHYESLESIEIVDFVNTVLSDRPATIVNDDYVDNLYAGIGASDPTYKIIHLADLHLDFKYEEGTRTDCRSTICCRKSNGYSSDTSKQAGPMGTYKCDSPINLITYLGEYIAANIDADAVVWTGDSIPHDDFRVRFKDREQIMSRLTDFFNTNMSST